MDVVLLQDVEKVGLRGRGRLRLARLHAQLPVSPGSSPSRRLPRSSPRSRRRDAERAKHEARSVEQARDDRGDADEDRAALRGEGGPAGRAVRVDHADRHGGRALARPQGARGPAEDRPRRADQARRPLRDPDRGLPGRRRRCQDDRRRPREASSAEWFEEPPEEPVDARPSRPPRSTRARKPRRARS